MLPQALLLFLDARNAFSPALVEPPFDSCLDGHDVGGSFTFLLALERAADAVEVMALPREGPDVMLALLTPGAGFHLGRGIAVLDALAEDFAVRQLHPHVDLQGRERGRSMTRALARTRARSSPVRDLSAEWPRF